VVDAAANWLQRNIGVAAAVLAIVGTVVGFIIAAASWFASVHHLERRVDVLRNEVNVMRATMDDNKRIVAEVRRGLEATDASVKEGIARLEERIKAGERR
jgi:large-conductance mechanosensitive channel